MPRSSLADVLPKLQRQSWRGIHAVHAVGDGFVCMHRYCSFATRDLTAVVAHAVENQFVALTEVEAREEEGER